MWWERCKNVVGEMQGCDGEMQRCDGEMQRCDGRDAKMCWERFLDMVGEMQWRDARMWWQRCIVVVQGCVRGEKIKRRVKLEGVELEEYMKKKLEKEQEASRLKDEQLRKEKEEMESSDESETELDSEDLLTGRPKGKHDLMIKSQIDHWAWHTDRLTTGRGTLTDGPLGVAH
ncbi:hypothetical protein Btru_014598 [Bulinus truncatus]|nr:hypothetical protein Btru_014598 [Bulinus truncatus]